MTLLTGSAAQWATLAAIIIGGITAWFKYGPDRKRADNEGIIIANMDAERLRREYDDLNQQNRKDIHDLKDKLAVTEAAIHQSDKALLKAASVQLQDRADMNSMMFLIDLLISEVKRLDPDPENKIIAQAEMVLAHMREQRTGGNPSQTPAMNTADHTLADAKQTVRSATVARDEIKASEAKE